MNAQINIHNPNVLGGSYFMDAEDAEKVRDLLNEAAQLLGASRGGYQIVLNIDVWSGR